MKKKLMYTSIILVILSLVSKVFAFVKEIVLAYYYGTSIIVDSYTLSQNIATCLFTAITSAITIGYISSMSNEKDNDKHIDALNTNINFFSVVFIVISLICLLFSKQIVMLFAPGFSEDIINMTTTMVNLMLPFSVFYSFLFLSSADLQTKNTFWHIGIYNIIANIVLVLSIVLSRGSYQILAIGFGLSIFAQALFVYLLNIRKGHKLKFNFNTKSKEFKNTLMIAYPIFFVEVFNNLLLIIDKTFASTLGEGVISSISYSNRINTLFLSFFVSIISTVLLPTLVVKAEKKTYDEYKSVSRDIYIYILLLTLPIMLFVVLCSKELIEVLFMRGAFDDSSVASTKVLLTIYGLSLPSLAITSVLKNQLYSLKKSKSSLLATFVSITLNILLDYLLIRFIGQSGIALASVVSSYVLLIILYFLLKKKIGKMFNKDFLIEFLKMIISITISFVLFLLFNRYISIQSSLLLLIIDAIIIFGSYILCLFLFRFKELNYFIDIIKSKFLRKIIK